MFFDNDITKSHNQGEKDASEGKDRSKPWPRPFESDKSHNDRCKAYDEGYFHTVGQKDGADLHFSKSQPTGRAFESESSDHTREKAYASGYKNGAQSWMSKQNLVQRLNAAIPGVWSKASTQQSTNGGSNNKGGIGEIIGLIVLAATCVGLTFGSMWVMEHTATFSLAWVLSWIVILITVIPTLYILLSVAGALLGLLLLLWIIQWFFQHPW